jgi:hypothetical protein
VKFGTLLEFKTWIKEYAAKYFLQFMVIHSEAKKITRLNVTRMDVHGLCM